MFYLLLPLHNWNSGLLSNIMIHKNSALYLGVYLYTVFITLKELPRVEK